eukprot:GEMP01018813.1.p1 GENE.GEMP01018813.1~~GEMP01018813.1.p1  ORF type:complete len:664 (+),score=87.74 GEMP01018813.1:122-2113(+)
MPDDRKQQGADYMGDPNDIRNLVNVPLIPGDPRPLEERLATAKQGPTLIFDGVCNLCNHAMWWYYNRCRDSTVSFMWVQHDDTQILLAELGISDSMKSWVYLNGNVIYRGSTAWLRACSHLCMPWSFMAKFEVVPPMLRDAVYNTVSTNRYRLWGFQGSCMLPPRGLKDRFLHSTVAPSGGQESPTTSSEIRKLRLLVVGLSFGGLSILERLSSDFDCVGVDHNNYSEYIPGALRALVHEQVDYRDLHKDYTDLAAKHGFSFVHGIVTHMGSRECQLTRITAQPAGRLKITEQVATILRDNGEQIEKVFDCAVISCGATYRTAPLKAISTTLKNRIADLTRERRCIEEASSVCIVGAGQVGVELAGELRSRFVYDGPELCDSSSTSALSERGCNLNDVPASIFFENGPVGRSKSITMCELMPTVLPRCPEKAQEYVSAWCRKHGVHLHLGKALDEKEKTKYDIVLDCTRPKVVRTPETPWQTLHNGGLVVNSHLQVLGDDETPGGCGRIFALGDCVVLNSGEPCDKNGYTTNGMVDVIVDNLARITRIRSFKSDGECSDLQKLSKKPSTPLVIALGRGDAVLMWDRFVPSTGACANAMKSIIESKTLSQLRKVRLGRLVLSLACCANVGIERVILPPIQQCIAPRGVRTVTPNSVHSPREHAD